MGSVAASGVLTAMTKPYGAQVDAVLAFNQCGPFEFDGSLAYSSSSQFSATRGSAFSTLNGNISFNDCLPGLVAVIAVDLDFESRLSFAPYARKSYVSGSMSLYCGALPLYLCSWNNILTTDSAALDAGCVYPPG
jgi:hypothetical protein